MRRAGLLALAAALCVWSRADAAGQALFQRDVYLMGTRALLAAYAGDREAGVAVLETTLDVLEDAEAELSTWRPDTPVSRLNRQPVGQPWTAAPALCRVFADVYEWQRVTAGAFDPAVGALAAAWRIHEGGRRPQDDELARARRQSGLRLLDFDPNTCTVVRRADVAIDTGAFGKGEALDRVATALAGRTWLVDLGGQVAVGGAVPGGGPWEVQIAHPLDRERAVMQVELRSGSLSTSGGSERDVYVGDVRVGHIIDPRTGAPAPFAGSVVVWHERALVADILSTALYVMGPEEGVPWAEARGLTAAFLMVGSGGSIQTAATSRWAEMRPALISDSSSGGN